MSELQTFDSPRIYWACEQVERVAGDIDNLHLDDTSFYFKSEADKVIEELKHQRDGAFGLANSGLTLDDLTQMAKKEIDRQKYKRCLAMAERCKYRMYYLSAVIDYESSKLVPNPTAVKRHTKKESRMDYWKNRWLELAEQFKEDK